MNTSLQLYYCQAHAAGTKTCTCSSLATYKVKLNFESGKIRDSFRCEQHKFKGTTGGRIDQDAIQPFDQTEVLKQVNTVLNSFIGKPVPNKLFKHITGKYIGKDNNGGLMCQNSNGKWKYIYYRQITKS